MTALESRQPDGPDDESLAVLDEPLDRRGIAELLDRPGLASSTRRLIVVLAVVLVFAAGALLGGSRRRNRAAPKTRLSRARSSPSTRSPEAPC